jgi:hypothetical protein
MSKIRPRSISRSSVRDMNQSDFHEVDSADSSRPYDMDQIYTHGSFDLGGVRFGHHENYLDAERDHEEKMSYFRTHPGYACKENHSGKGPKDYKRSDLNIYEDVCEALYRSADINASDIGVSVEKGIVFLTGHVENRKMKRDAEDLVEDIFGVIDVQNRIQLVPH